VIPEESWRRRFNGHLWDQPPGGGAHVARLFTKLDALDRVQLVIIAYELGLVSPPR
jgi:hypothetical protein